jgi:hypothetical protein
MGPETALLEPQPATVKPMTASNARAVIAFTRSSFSFLGLLRGRR